MAIATQEIHAMLSRRKGGGNRNFRCPGRCVGGCSTAFAF
jgi:hypothetical protein